MAIKPPIVITATSPSSATPITPAPAFSLNVLPASVNLAPKVSVVVDAGVPDLKSTRAASGRESKGVVRRPGGRDYFTPCFTQRQCHKLTELRGTFLNRMSYVATCGWREILPAPAKIVVAIERLKQLQCPNTAEAVRTMSRP